MRSIRLIKGDSIQTKDRVGAADGTAEISWAISDKEGAVLRCGFGRWHEALCEPKRGAEQSGGWSRYAASFQAACACLCSHPRKPSSERVA
jgi:hypothetical protein